MSRIPFLDLAALHAPLRAELDEVWTRVVAQSSFVGGQCVDAFEQAWAAACGTATAIGVANGTDALELVLRAAGVGAGDEVIVPANTFVATAEAVISVGATPRFVDVDDADLLVTADLVADAITPRTAAVIPVHLWGQMVDMAPIVALADRHGLLLLEDAAQAHLADHDGRGPGRWGAAAGFSFYPGKNLGAFGDGGAIVTDDLALAAEIRSIADHGRDRASKYEHRAVGRNSRLDGLQAAVLGVKLPHLRRWNEQRRQIARWYDEGLAGLPLRPIRRHRGTDVFHHYVVRTARRDELIAEFDRRGIGCGIHYPIPCHRQPAFASARPPESLPVVERAATEIVSLPVHPLLTEHQVSDVCDVVARHLADRRAA